MAKLDNGFYWISSITGKEELLKELDTKLAHFYSQLDGRDAYQNMLDGIVEMPPKGEFSHLILDYLLQSNKQNILEVGCGNGRIYRQLKNLGFKGKYTGVEVADYVINSNRNRSPEAEWITGGAYHVPVDDNSMDLCFSFFVLEHLVYPKDGLTEMMRKVKDGGELVLVFPDFVASGRLASQQLGFSPVDTASQKLKKGRILDAIISLYDSKIRLPRALRNVHLEIGEFPVNTNLVCFNYPNIMSHDIDAVYIASKIEVEKWAKSFGYTVEYPFGVQDELNEKAFIVIKKQ